MFVLKENPFININNSANWNFGIIQIVTLILLGVICASNPIFITIIWSIFIIYTVYLFMIGKTSKIWYFVAMSPGLEILGRMVYTSALPLELGKYYLYLVIILFSFSALIHTYKLAKPKYYIGGVMILILLPSVIVSCFYNSFTYQNYIFNYSGIFQLSIFLIFAARERKTNDEFYNLLKVSTIPNLPILTYLTIKTPKFEDIDFDLGSNFSTTGGFGSNQVSTIIGSYILTLALLLILKKPAYKNILVNWALILYGVFRGLLTFSRGGMLIAAIAIIVTLIIISMKNFKTFIYYTAYLIISLVIGVFFFVLVNNLTNNFLYLRYIGETQGTLEKSREKNLDIITSNRSAIALTDLYIFYDNFIFGVGPGESRKYRTKYGGYNIIAHTEYTRLLSEHGLGGLIVVLILSIFPFFWIRKIKSRELKGTIAALYILGIGTCLHAAMRTNTTVVYYALASLPLINITKKNNISKLKNNTQELILVN